MDYVVRNCLSIDRQTLANLAQKALENGSKAELLSELSGAYFEHKGFFGTSAYCRENLSVMLLGSLLIDTKNLYKAVEVGRVFTNKYFEGFLSQELKGKRSETYMLYPRRAAMVGDAD